MQGFPSKSLLIKYIMKKLFYLLAVVLLSLSLSCSKDGAIDKSKLVGSWDCVEMSVKGSSMGQEFNETETFEPGESVLQFDADGTFSSYSDGDLEASGEYSVKGSKLVLSVEDETVSITIHKLTAKELVIGATETFTEGNVKVTETMQATFKKM